MFTSRQFFNTLESVGTRKDTLTEFEGVYGVMNRLSTESNVSHFSSGLAQQDTLNHILNRPESWETSATSTEDSHCKSQSLPNLLQLWLE